MSPCLADVGIRHGLAFPQTPLRQSWEWSRGGDGPAGIDPARSLPVPGCPHVDRTALWRRQLEKRQGRFTMRQSHLTRDIPTRRSTIFSRISLPVIHHINQRQQPPATSTTKRPSRVSTRKHQPPHSSRLFPAHSATRSLYSSGPYGSVASANHPPFLYTLSPKSRISRST